MHSLKPWVIAKGAVLSAVLLSGGAQAEQATPGVQPTGKPATQFKLPVPRNPKPLTGALDEAPLDAQAQASPKIQIGAPTQSQSGGQVQAEAVRKLQSRRPTDLPLQHPEQKSTEIQLGEASRAPNRPSSQAGTTAYPMTASREHEAVQAESRAQGNPYGGSRYSQYRQSRAAERRKDLAARAKAFRERIDQYRAAHLQWYAPWWEARHQWIDARHDYFREQSEQRFEEFLAESDYLRDGVNPPPSLSAWGPYGGQPRDPIPAPWGPYPW